ncbi:response regulator transcription factor [Metabacillus fastidiosus]|uniref:response regulator transcription factor n=1 Tax=Metabacillus fastidiosus TaxID=1458 RepID=UPI002E1E2BEB|nr:response regulator transcription factor [Metabacillus fastidiosus]
MSIINVLIVDDHKIVRSGLSMLISEHPKINVVGTASDGMEAYNKCTELNPDIVLMDLNMPLGDNGLIATKRIKESFPHIKVLILTMHDEREYIFRVLHSGASGYLLKSAEVNDLINAIQTVSRGEAYLYPKATTFLIEDYMNRAVKDEENDICLLSAREQEVLSYLAKGYSNKEISELLYVSVKTVEAHKANIMQKLKLQTRPELVKYAFKNGLLDFV